MSCLRRVHRDTDVDNTILDLEDLRQREKPNQLDRARSKRPDVVVLGLVHLRDSERRLEAVRRNEERRLKRTPARLANLRWPDEVVVIL